MSLDAGRQLVIPRQTLYWWSDFCWSLTVRAIGNGTYNAYYANILRLACKQVQSFPVVSLSTLHTLHNQSVVINHTTHTEESCMTSAYTWYGKGFQLRSLPSYTVPVHTTPLLSHSPLWCLSPGSMSFASTSFMLSPVSASTLWITASFSIGLKEQVE